MQIMTVIQKFHYVWPPGATPMELNQWIDTLSNKEQKEFSDAVERQRSFRQQAIERGDMILLDNAYVWKDIETANRGKETDEVWEKYWNRWRQETGVIFSSTFEKFKD